MRWARAAKYLNFNTSRNQDEKFCVKIATI